MPSKIIGRADCPECGFHSAHIKQKTLPDGEVDPTKKPYRYCPDGCGNYFPPNAKSIAQMLSKMRPEGGAAVPVPEKPAPAAPDDGKASAKAGGGVKVVKNEPEAPAPVKTKKKGFFAGVGV